MILKELKTLFGGRVRTFDGKRVFYMYPYDLHNHVSNEDWDIIKDWNGICIYSSPKGKPNECFYFNWGYGGSPEYIEHIKIFE